jgi:hypothetical protein
MRLSQCILRHLKIFIQYESNNLCQVCLLVLLLTTNNLVKERIHLIRIHTQVSITLFAEFTVTLEYGQQKLIDIETPVLLLFEILFLCLSLLSCMDNKLEICFITFPNLTVFETAWQTNFGWKYSCQRPSHKPSQNL